MVKLRDDNPIRSDGRVDVSRWIERVSRGRDNIEVEIISRACSLVELAHGDEVNHPSGQTCQNQGFVMAEILHDLDLDADTIAAGIIYPTYAYCELDNTKIKELLGSDVVDLVDGLKKMEEIHSSSLQDLDGLSYKKSLDNLRRLLLAVVDDIRVVLIKLAEHTVNMRFAVNWSEEQQQKIAKITREIYAPLANRLGIGQIKWELEDFAFRFLEPKAYKNIAKLLDEKRIDREQYIKDVSTVLENKLAEENIKATINGRAKHIYSIWNKMKRKDVGYDEIYDVRAFRIFVSNIKDCYGALGVVHSLWEHIPKEFDDYIARPKENGYQSLHTAVIGPKGKNLEVQIRTKEMHEKSELGVAAHWRYKEGGEHDSNLSAKLNSLRKLFNFDSDTDTSESEPSIEPNIDIIEERVYVFTPSGDVINLAKGSTALDFAYAIHTEIGDRCRGAKVGGKIVPLTHVLENGERVEVLTAKTGGPSRDWLNPHLKYVQTSRAKSKILSWFKQQDREINIAAGKEILTRELKRLAIDNISASDLMPRFKNLQTEEDLLASLGAGDIKSSQLLGAIQVISEPLKTFKREFTKPRQNTKGHAEVTVEGVGNLLCHMAKCCKPVPGDEIIGYITIGEGVSVHRKDCPNILAARENKKNRLIQVAWGEDTYQNYNVDIVIKAYDRKGLLRDITSILAAEKINVLSINTLSNKENNTADFKLNLEVDSVEELGKILTKIQQLPNIVEAFRIRS